MDTQQATQVTVFSHKSVEYYTPPEYIEAARRVMGGIHMDPASCDFAQEWIKADHYITKEHDGLAQDWYGRVWLNPPYSKTGSRSNQDIWAQKLEEEIAARRVTIGILLVKAALGYKWFERLFRRYPVCFTRNRIRFLTVDGPMPPAKQANAFFLLQPGDWWPHDARFRDEFSQFGRVIYPDRTRQ